METVDGSVGNRFGHWSAQAKASVVLSVLSRQASSAEAAAANGLAQAQVAAWIGAFVEAGEYGLRGGAPPPSAVGLAEENGVLRVMLRETRRRARMWQTAAGGDLGPCATLR